MHIVYLIVETSALEHKYRGRLQEIVAPLFFSKIPVFCFFQYQSVAGAERPSSRVTAGRVRSNVMPQIFTFTVSDPEGMHARPAGRLVAKAQEYESSITVAYGGKSVDAKRIFGVMGLDVQQGDEVTVRVQGNDEAVAAAEFERFLKEHL